MTRLSVPIAIGLWLACASASSAQVPPTPVPPRLTVIVPKTPGVSTPQLRQNMENALEKNGATLVPDTELRGAEQRLDIPTGKPPSAPAVKQLADELNLAGVVEVRVSRDKARSTRTRPRYQAELRVVGPDGVQRVNTQLPLASNQLSPQEASTLAGIAVDAVKPPAAPPAPPPPPAALEPGPPVPPPEATAAPAIPPPATPETAKKTKGPPQRVLVFAAAPNLTWRSGTVNAAPPTPSLNFNTGTPYAGFTLAVETQPFNSPWARYIGFDLLYSFSVVGISALNPVTSLNTRETATENRLLANVIGHTPGGILGGDLTLSLGVAYQGFVLNPVGSLVSSQHVGPRFAGGYRHPLFKGVEVDASFGYRPFSHPGGGLTIPFGDTEQSWGIDASAGVSGPLDVLVKNLRWMAGYNFLRYSDRFRSPTGSGTTSNIENYNRALIGFTYQPPIHY